MATHKKSKCNRSFLTFYFLNYEIAWNRLLTTAIPVDQYLWYNLYYFYDEKLKPLIQNMNINKVVSEQLT